MVVSAGHLRRRYPIGADPIRPSRGSVMIEAAIVLPLFVLIALVLANLYLIFSDVNQVEQSLNEAVKYAPVLAVTEPSLTTNEILNRAGTRAAEILEKKCARCSAITIQTATRSTSGISGSDVILTARFDYSLIPIPAGPAKFTIALASSGVLKP